VFGCVEVYCICYILPWCVHRTDNLYACADTFLHILYTMHTTPLQSMLLTDMQHFLAQQKSSSSNEIALLQEMEVDTHNTDEVRVVYSVCMLMCIPKWYIQFVVYYVRSMHALRTLFVSFNCTNHWHTLTFTHTTHHIHTLQSNMELTGTDSVGVYNGSGMRGGLTRPIVLGDGTSSTSGSGSGTSGVGTSSSATGTGGGGTSSISGMGGMYGEGDGEESEEARLLRLDSARCVFVCRVYCVLCFVFL
jgi:uncharacterized membrane protein YgcG